MSSSPASAAAAIPRACSIPSSAITIVELIGVEAGGRGSNEGEHAATLTHGKPGVLHGSHELRPARQGRPNRQRPFRLRRPRLSRRRPRTQLLEGHPPRHTTRTSATTTPSRRSALCSKLEGILPALETAHAIVEAVRVAAKRSHEDVGGGLLLGPRRQGLLRGGAVGGGGDRGVKISRKLPDSLG